MNSNVCEVTGEDNFFKAAALGSHTGILRFSGSQLLRGREHSHVGELTCRSLSLSLSRHLEAHDDISLVSSAIAFLGFASAEHKPPSLSGNVRVRNFKRPKNHEDSSDLDDFLTESIATAQAIIF